MTEFRFDDADAYVHGTPHAALARLRRDAPFSWQPLLHDARDGYWLVTKHADITAISKNPKVFATHAPLLNEPLPRALWDQFPALRMIADNLMTFDHTRHSTFRTIGNALFSSDRLAAISDRIRATCAEILADAAARDHVDFADDVALSVSVRVILGLFLGAPAEDLNGLARDILTINAMDDPVFRPARESFLDAAERLCRCGAELYRRFTERPAENVFSDLARHRAVDGTEQQELFFVFWFPLAAGAFDTTASTIAGGVQAVLERPDQLARLRADRSLIPTAVDEMLRWVSPVIYFRRTAVTDVEYGGRRIACGQKLLLCYAAANRDEEVFLDADAFDVARTPNHYLSFGYGPHFCLGARVATLVLRVFLDEFLDRLPHIRLDGPVIHTRSAWMNRIRSMPVRIDRRSASEGQSGGTS